MKMKLLDRYISRTVAAAIAVVLLIVVGLDIIFALTDQMGDLRGDYQFWQAVIYVLLTTPKALYEMMPLSVLTGCLLGLGALAATSELTVMRAAGVSVARIAWSVVKPALWFIGAAVLISELVVPSSEAYAQSQREVARSLSKTYELDFGYWHREGNEYTHLRSVVPGGVLLGVTQYHFDQQRRLLSSTYAERATFQGDHWLLEEVERAELGEHQASTQQLAELRWNTSLTPELLQVLVVEPEDLSILGLRDYGRYLAEQGLDAGEYQLAYWRKLLQPLATVVMVVLALSFIFGPLRSVSMGSRVFAGVVMGMLFKYSEEFLGPASIVFGFAPLLASLAPILLFTAVAVVLLRRAA